MVVSMLKNWSRRYSTHYIIKFIGFMSIYYAINLDIVSSYMVFSYLYLKSVRPEKFQFLERGQNRNFDYKIVIFVKNPEFIL